MLRSTIAVALLIAGTGSSAFAQDTERQKMLQDAWRDCLITFATRAAIGTDEDADTIQRAAFATCSAEQDNYFNFLMEQPEQFREFLTEQLFPAVRGSYRDEVLAAVISERF